MNRMSYRLLAGLIFAAIIVGGYFWQQREQRPPAAVPAAASAPAASAAAAPPAVAAAPSEPAIQHPVAPASAALQPLPALEQSDSTVQTELTALLGAKALSFLQLDGFVRRFVATVDNLARAHAAPRLWPVNPMPGRFQVSGAAGRSTVAADNGLRYAPFVLFVESIDARRAVALYTRLYPLFQQAYEDLGYPGRYFNDRLVEVIDRLLATPEPTTPIAVTLTEVNGPHAQQRPWLHYEYADPTLESLAAGQKMLLRSGPVNERRLKARLAEFRRALVAAPAGR